MLRRLPVRVGSTLAYSTSFAAASAPSKIACVGCPAIALTQRANFHITPLCRDTTTPFPTGSGEGSPGGGAMAAHNPVQKAVACYNVDGGPSIVVEVQQDKIDPGEFFVRGLRDAIASYKMWEGAPSTIKIYPRKPDGTSGDEIANGILEGKAFNFKLPSAARKRGRTEDEIFTDAGTWPTTLDPATVLNSTTSTALSFVTTAAGEWVFAAGLDRMVRPKEYKIVWDRLELLRNATGRRGLLIKGHPGIGKTLLLDVLLAMSLHEHPTVPVIAIAGDGIHVFTNLDRKTPKRYKVDPEGETSFRSPQHLQNLGVAPGAEMLVLHDIKGPNSLPYKSVLLENLFNVFSVVCVVASSPDPENFIDFYKATVDGTYDMVVLPTLDLSEARAFVSKRNPTVDDATFAEWFDSVGGVPRHLVSQQAVTMAAQDQKMVAKRVQFDPTASACDEETNKIVQMLPADDRLSVKGFDFVSQGACRVWIESHEGTANISKLLKQLREAK